MSRLWYRADRLLNTDESGVSDWSPDPNVTTTPITGSEYQLTAGASGSPAFTSSDASFDGKPSVTFAGGSTESLADVNATALHDLLAGFTVGTDGLTMFAAMKVDVPALTDVLFSVGNGAGNELLEWRTTDSGAVRLSLLVEDTGGDVSASSATSTLDTTPRVYAVRLGADRLVEHFRGTTLDGSSSLAGTVDALTVLSAGALGARHDDTLHISATVAEFAFWDRKLSDVELRAVINYMRRRFKI